MQRILFDCSFALSALKNVLARWRPEVVVVISPRLQLGVTGLAGVPVYVFHRMWELANSFANTVAAEYSVLPAPSI
jgi:hypothetical protein